MDHQEILNLLNKSSDSKYVARKWNIVNDQLNANYDAGNKMHNRDVLKSSLCNWNDAYILIRGNISIIVDNEHKVLFKNDKCITKIDETIDNAEGLDLVMSMYNLLKYSSNYSDTMGSLWFYSKDEATNFNADIVEIFQL